MNKIHGSFFLYIKKSASKQALAELCQAQVKLEVIVEALGGGWLDLKEIKADLS